MNIHNIIYQKTFNLGMYQSEKIGVEISLNENEDPKEALSAAKLLVEEYHRESSNGYDAMMGTIVRDIGQPQSHSLVDDIKTCKELTVLESYKLIVRGKPELQAAYDETFKKLSL